MVKLGGSVITHKDRYRAFNQEATDRLTSEIVRSGKEVIIVHGAGSFGHILAKKYQLHKGYIDKKQVQGISKVMLDVRDLNLRVMRSLDKSGLPASSIPPSACAMMKDGMLYHMEMSAFQNHINLGITPVTFGDVVPDKTRRFGICSGDQLMMLLAQEFKPERIIFCADVDGIFTSDPHIDRGARLIRIVRRATLDALPRTSRYADVTGSIFSKIQHMLRISQEGGSTMVINGLVKGRLEKALKGQKVIGSQVEGG